MDKIVEYRLVNGVDILDITKSVNYWIERGFQPFGGISCSHALSADGEYNECLYAQGMVRFEYAKTN